MKKNFGGNMKQKLYQMLVGVIAVSSVLMAAGKIRGTVVDEKTKEAMVGANIVIVGTSFGSVSDIDGNFIIMNIQPGTYSLRASFLGYQNVVINNVMVNDGLSSEVNFKLPSSEVELNEVVIIQERPLVNKNATSAVRIGTREDIEKLPVRGIIAAVILSPGVVQQNGLLYRSMDP